MKLAPYIKSWLPLAVGLTAVLGGVYGTGQQIYRQSANDALAELNQTAAIMIKNNQDPASLVKALPHLGNDATLSPFMTLYNEQRQPSITSQTINGQTAVPPMGTFDAAKSGQRRFTWEPLHRMGGSRLRFAAALSYYPGHGYILAARSLYPTEQHIADLGKLMAAGWAVTMLVTLAVVAAVTPRKKVK